MGLFSSIFRPLAYLSLPVILLGSVSAASPKGHYYTRMFVYLGTLASVATASIVTATTMAALGHPHDVNFYVARMFHALIWRFMNIRVELEGEEHLQNRPAIIMCNHQSIVDMVVVGKVMPKATAMMAKKELQFSPVGPFMMLSGAVFIDRGNNEKAIRSLKVATDLMKRLKFSLFIFPEGTRHLGPEADLLPFKKGGFHMAVQAGIPIVPVVAENYWHIYRKGYFGSGVIKVRVLPPVSTEGLTTADINGLMDLVRGQMLEALREISVHARKPAITERKEKPSSVGVSEKDQHAFSGASIAINPSTPSTTSDADGPQLDGPQGSSASLSSFATSSQLWKSVAGSETGGETEEEDMVMVDRPERK
ncbi:putative 1-acyl-sn-glycerol-3-phosphate acyltransferase [Leucoagaricus sp. SymC.cos]|nr:putative 1-acyl-sn-glycerol-3-phosphate acyltransferase [Leucoagaricus sp. SymC.cos]